MSIYYSHSDYWKLWEYLANASFNYEIYTVEWYLHIYRRISNIRRNKSQNLNDPRLVLQLFLSNPLKPGVKSRMNM